MLKKYKFILADKLQNIFYYLIRAYSRTFRLRVENEKPLARSPAGRRKDTAVLLASAVFSAVRYFKNMPPIIRR